MQAKAVGFPLYKIYIPDPCTMEQYEVLMEKEMSRLKNDLQITHVGTYP